MYSIADIKKMTRDTIETGNEKNRKTVYDNSDKGIFACRSGCFDGNISYTYINAIELFWKLRKS